MRFLEIFGAGVFGWGVLMVVGIVTTAISSNQIVVGLISFGLTLPLGLLVLFVRRVAQGVMSR